MIFNCALWWLLGALLIYCCGPLIVVKTEHDDAIHSSRDWKIQTIPKLDQYMAWVGTNLVDLVIDGSNNVMQRYDNDVMCRKNYALVFYVSINLRRSNELYLLPSYVEITFSGCLPFGTSALISNSSIVNLPLRLSSLLIWNDCFILSIFKRLFFLIWTNDRNFIWGF